MDVKEWAWWTIMIKGEVCVASKKLGQTRPPNVSSNLDIVELGKNWERRKRMAPFHAGHTGSRAYFWMVDILRMDVDRGCDVSISCCELVGEYCEVSVSSTS